MRHVIFFISVALLACSTEKPVEQNKLDNHTNQTGSINVAPPGFRNGYADVNGIKMYYEIYGEGKPLVLIHGGGSTIQTTFGTIIPHLVKNRQLIAVELQAHGRTSDRTSDLSFEQDADDVASLLKILNVSKADFCGFSNGGTTALKIAIRHPQLAIKVIAASPLLKRDGVMPQFWEAMKGAKLEQMPRELSQAFLEVNGDSTRLQILHDKCARRMVEFKDVPDADLQSIKAEVLLVNGDADVATSEHIVKMSRLIRNCRLAIIPGGHGEYLGEVTTLKPGHDTNVPILPVLEKFLE